MPVVGTLKLNNCNYVFAYDLIEQSVANNTSTVSFYCYLDVLGSQISWSSGSAWVHTARTNLQTTYYNGRHLVIQSNFTFTHNNDGTLTLAPGFGLDTTFTSGSGIATITLPQIKRFAQITSAPSSLNDEENPYITFTNPGNATNLNAWLEVNPNGSHIAPRNIDISSGTYTWELTNEEREQLRAVLTTSNKGTIRLGLYSTQSGTTSASYKDIPYEIINAEPTGLSATIVEANEKIIDNNLTRGRFVNGYSNIQGTITHLAEAKKGGRIVKYKMIMGDKSEEIPIDTRQAIIYNIPPVIRNQLICEFQAIDNRGNIATYGIVSSESGINYSAIQLDKSNCNLERTSTGENATLTLNGTFWNGNFGVKTNEIRNITYIIKRADGTETTGTTTITPTINDSSFTFNGLIAGDNNTEWNLGDVYEVELTISDYLTEDKITFTLNSAYPTLCLDKQGVGIMCAYDSQLGGYLQVNGKVVGEDIYSTDEVKTNKIWINGKPIYRKVLSFTTSSTINSFVNEAHGISNVDTFLPNVSFSIKYNNNWYINPNDIVIETYVNNTNFSYYNKSQYMASKPAYVILEYTKTTD